MATPTEPGQTPASPLLALPDDVRLRVLVGIPRDDLKATASACQAFHAAINSQRFPALRRRYGFEWMGL